MCSIHDSKNASNTPVANHIVPMLDQDGNAGFQWPWNANESQYNDPMLATPCNPTLANLRNSNGLHWLPHETQFWLPIISLMINH